jgi:hypothetical protein
MNSNQTLTPYFFGIHSNNMVSELVFSHRGFRLQHCVGQICTRFLHACSALCKCANWLCRTCTPHHTVAGRSSASLTHIPFAFPSNCRCGPPLTSYMPGRSIPCTRARHSSTHHHTLCAVHGLCTSGVGLHFSSLPWVLQPPPLHYSI